MASRKKTKISQRADFATDLSKVVVPLAEFIGLTRAELSGIIGVSPELILRMAGGDYVLNGKSLQSAVCLVNVARSLNEIHHGNAESVKAWMANRNADLDAVPRDEIKTAIGLVQVMSYVEAQRILASVLRE